MEGRLTELLEVVVQRSNRQAQLRFPADAKKDFLKVL